MSQFADTSSNRCDCDVNVIDSTLSYPSSLSCLFHEAKNTFITYLKGNNNNNNNICIPNAVHIPQILRWSVVYLDSVAT